MTEEKSIRNNRNYGIDLLRIIAMLYVVILHSLGRGGVLNTSEVGSPQYMVAWFMELWAYCAVDIFALISGYVGFSEVEKKQKYSSYIVMWLQVVTYGIVVTEVYGMINADAVTIQDYWDMLKPVSNNLYWYFTAYTGVFIIMPFLNAAVRGCSEKQLKRLLIIMFIVFSCFDNIVKSLGMGNGYTFIWIALLYLVGAAIKKCNIGKNIKPATAFIGIVILIILSWLWKIYGFEFKILGKVVNNHLFVAYTSPTICAVAMLYIVGFSKIRFPKMIEKVIGFLAPGAFAVYILNNQRFIWNYMMNERFTYLSTCSVWRLVADVLLFAVSFVVVSILIDRVRILLFRVCQINWLAEKAAECMDKVWSKLKL